MIQGIGMPIANFLFISTDNLADIFLKMYHTNHGEKVEQILTKLHSRLVMGRTQIFFLIFLLILGHFLPILCFAPTFGVLCP